MVQKILGISSFENLLGMQCELTSGNLPEEKRRELERETDEILNKDLFMGEDYFGDWFGEYSEIRGKRI